MFCLYQLNSFKLKLIKSIRILKKQQNTAIIHRKICQIPHYFDLQPFPPSKNAVYEYIIEGICKIIKGDKHGR